MRYYRYAPSVRAVIAHREKDGSDTYYDVSDDISSCILNLTVDSSSQAQVVIANPRVSGRADGKYNDKFLPMDRIAITASKDEPQRMFTGYITSVTRMTLYAADMTIRAVCPIGRLSRIYYDPMLYPTQLLMRRSLDMFDSDGRHDSDGDSDYDKLIRNLLVQIGGMPTESVLIGDIPTNAIMWAQRMFAARNIESKQARDMVNQLMTVLRSSGPKSSSTSLSRPTAGGTGTVTPAPAGTPDRMKGAIEEGYRIAADDTITYSQGAWRYKNPNVDCSSMVWYELHDGSGFTEEEIGPVDTFETRTMRNRLTNAGFTEYGYAGMDSLQPGDILLNPGYHTAIYVGDGKNLEAVYHSEDEKVNSQPGVPGVTPDLVLEQAMWMNPTYVFRWERQ